jgi:exodeoxyribonuclease-3
MTNLTLLSWNVNGIRAVYRKGFLPWLQAAAPDILRLQETKTMVSQLPVELAQRDTVPIGTAPNVKATAARP